MELDLVPLQDLDNVTLKAALHASKGFGSLWAEALLIRGDKVAATSDI
jgi:hypothetical protein